MQNNIVFITIDCLRSDSIGITNKKVDSPFMNKLAKQGIFFQNVIASSPWSGGSGPSIFTGTYPLSSDGEISLRNRGKSFVEVLRDKGFTTIGITSNPFFTADNNYNKGFDYFYDWYTSSNPEIYKVKTKLKFKKFVKNIVKSISFLESLLHRAVRLQRKLSKKLLKRNVGSYANIEKVNAICRNAVNYFKSKKKKKPIFIWLHYMDCHEPISIPQDFISPTIQSKRNHLNTIYRNKKIDKDKQSIYELQRLYYDSIHYVDTHLEKIIKFLKQNLDGETIYYITADHGQGFGETKKHFGHGLVHLKELLSVPLILFSKNLPQKKRTIEQRVPLQAIGNVILEMSGNKTKFGMLNTFIDCKFHVHSPAYIITEEGREHEKDFVSEDGYKLDWKKRSFSVFKNDVYYVHYSRTNTEELYRFSDNKNVLSDPKYNKSLLEFRNLLKNHIKENYQEPKIINKISI